MSVTAVVLTYNRAILVSRCVKAILSSSVKCDRIIVVDNGSTDDTQQVLRQFNPAKVVIHALDKNVGAAGGFNVALRLGHESGADFVWVMDDDVICEPSALAELLAAWRTLDARGIEAPYVISSARAPSGILTNVPDIDRRMNALFYQNWPDLLEESMVPVTRATFVSALFSRETIERYGLPIADMFIWGEDAEYTLRVTRDRPGWLIGRSRVEHVRAAAGAPNIRTEHDPVRIGWHRKLVRNNLYLDRLYRSRRWVAWRVLQNAKLGARLLLHGEPRKARIVLGGLIDGITFKPRIERVPACRSPEQAHEGADGGARNASEPAAATA